MIPYSYSMVDMGGIELSETVGVVVEGLYNRLAIGRNACGDLILYNWKFAGIEIAPSACSTIDSGTSIVINGAIEVTEEDVVSVIAFVPEPPVIVPLDVVENGIYQLESGIDGYAPVSVNVPDSGFFPSEMTAQFVSDRAPKYSGGYEYRGYIYGTTVISRYNLTLLYDASQGGASSITLIESLSRFSGVLLQGVYNAQRTSYYNTTIMYLRPELNREYWAGMQDRNSSYDCFVKFTSDTTATLRGNRQVIIYGIN